MDDFARCDWPGSREGSRLEAARSDPVIKRCECGCAYTAREWAKLRLLGLQTGPRDDLELRLCGACGSSIATRARRGG